MAREL